MVELFAQLFDFLVQVHILGLRDPFKLLDTLHHFLYRFLEIQVLTVHACSLPTQS